MLLSYCILLITGCDTSLVLWPIYVGVGSTIARDTSDITKLSNYKGEDIWKYYQRNGIYRLKRELLFGKVFTIKARKEYELLPPCAEPGEPKATCLLHRMPKSISEYKSDPKKWQNIKGVVPKGTLLEMKKVIFEQFIDIHYFCYIGVFIDGPYKGEPVILGQCGKQGDNSENLELV